MTHCNRKPKLNLSRLPHLNNNVRFRDSFWFGIIAWSFLMSVQYHVYSDPMYNNELNTYLCCGGTLQILLGESTRIRVFIYTYQYIQTSGKCKLRDKGYRIWLVASLLHISRVILNVILCNCVHWTCECANQSMVCGFNKIKLTE